jgi:transposase-like protein
MEGSEVSFLKVLSWSEEQCREYLERQRWPDGARCPKCGAAEPWKITRKTATKNAVRSLYRCRSCKRQFTATIGTIFEDSKIPLNKWFAGIYLMCSSKKGISAHQLHRELEITYKSAWFMCHRVREAMGESYDEPLSGTVEADETYVGGRRRRGHPLLHERINDEVEMGLRPKTKRYWGDNKAVVFGILERGGRVRTFHVTDAIARTLSPILKGHIDKGAQLVTDGHPAYRMIKNHLRHDVIDHEVEYVRGDVHTQGIENYWSLLKRGLYGVFHHVDARYLSDYLREFEFRFNRRGLRDSECFAQLITQTRGRVLWYCQTPQPENPYA